jgi:hypothetical protein
MVKGGWIWRQALWLYSQSFFISLSCRFLYDMHSPRSGDGRGVSFGRIYTKDGTLAVTTSQEGLIRLTKAEQEKLRTKEGDAKL